MKKTINNDMLLRMGLYFVGMCLLLLAFTCTILRFNNHYLYAIARMKSNGVTHNELLAIQISVTFIVVSVVTAFSQKNDLIYWEDAIRYKLEKPLLTNFCALSSYLLADLLFTLIFVVMGNDLVYFTFLFALVFLCILTYRMVCAFFMHEIIKKQLERDYTNVKSRRRKNIRARDLYREYKRKTIQYTIKAIEERDVETVCENISFLYRQKEQEDVEFLIGCIIENQQYFMLSSIVKECRFIFSEAEHILSYFNICFQILSSDSVRFIKSIVRSIGEHVICDAKLPAQDRELYDFEINKLIKECERKNFNEVANEIMINYAKQKDGYYADQS